MNLEPHILLGFDILANTTVSVNNDTAIKCIFNTVTLNDTKELGGYVNEVEYTVIVKTSKLQSNIEALKGTLITTVDGSYKIVTLTKGNILTKLFAQSLNKL
jgi:hypothetical protein